MIQDLTLYSIETELSELLQLREQAVEDGELPETLSAIDQQIEAYCAAEVAKVDRTAGAIRYCEASAALVKAEADRLAARAKEWADRVESIKAAVLRAMQARGVKSLETPHTKFTVRGNGGVEPLELVGELIERRFRRVTVSLPLDLWSDVCRIVPTEILLKLSAEVRESTPEADNFEIREAIKRGETVKGARLLPRGQHLRIK